MRWIKWILLGLAILGAPLLIEEIKEKIFYAQRPLLRAMREALPYSATKAFFDRVPRGTRRPEAMAIMDAEKITCRPRAAQGEYHMVCHVKGCPCAVPRWHIEIDFDERDEVRTAYTQALKAVCET